MSRTLLHFCSACKEYTLQAECPKCNGPTKSPAPARYSPEDPYGEYRRRLKKMERDG